MEQFQSNKTDNIDDNGKDVVIEPFSNNILDTETDKAVDYTSSADVKYVRASVWPSQITLKKNGLRQASVQVHAYDKNGNMIMSPANNSNLAVKAVLPRQDLFDAINDPSDNNIVIRLKDTAIPMSRTVIRFYPRIKVSTSPYLPVRLSRFDHIYADLMITIEE